MNRRQFLRGVMAAVPVIAAPAALLEALEPTRTIFLPPRGGWLRYSGFEYIEVEAIIKRALGRDAVKTLDRLAWETFNRPLLPAERTAGLQGINQIIHSWSGSERYG